MEIKEGSKIYKRVTNKEYGTLDTMREIEWFALVEKYGSDESYGQFLRKYTFKKRPKLLDIGNGKVREMIEQLILYKDPKSDILKYSDPDEQYQGTFANKRYHMLVKEYFGEKYDGTIIDENHLMEGDKYTTDDLEGPSEIVLWRDYDNLLILDKKTKKSKTKKSKKSKKSKTKKAK